MRSEIWSASRRPAFDLGGDGPHRVGQLRAAAVVERERQGHPPVPRGQRLGVLDVAQHPLGHPAAPPADEAHPDAPLVEVVAAAEQQRLVEPHEEAHLVERTAPVLGGERVHRHPGEPELEPALDRVEQRLLTRGVALGALEARAAGPSARSRP